MTRSKSSKVALRSEPILERMVALKAEHPFWGYRRIWAHLRFVDHLPVNRKRILRIMREAGLLVKPNLRLRAKRTYSKSKPRAIRPNEWWGIDMTKVLVESFGWVYIVIVLDWYTKKVVGHHVGLRSTSRDWLSALDGAVNGQFPQGIREGEELSLMCDNGCQPTSLTFMETCSVLGIHQAFTSYNNPRGNADTERMMRTLKEECLWLREWTSPFELATAFSAWIGRYNQHYLHSALKYKTPVQFELEHQQQISHETQLVAS